LFHLAAGIAAFGVLNTLVEALFHTYLQRTNANLKARLAKLEALQAKMAALSQSSPDLAVALGIIREELGDQDAASGRRAWIQNGIFYALGVVTPIILNFLSHHVSIR
jgi:hypothetical protein